jgi:SPP1 gp7 family putative phage head morphogenesis protein
MPFRINPRIPPKETVEFFRKKGLIRPEKGYSFEDVEKDEHTRALTVAKATSYNLLQDFHDMLAQAASEGMTVAEFKRQLKPQLIEKGWWGRQLLKDPKTGVEKIVQLGSPRRLEIIYDTNMRTSRAVGMWTRYQQRKDVAPYLVYNAVLDSRTRPLHEVWGRRPVILPVDHPWWDTHFPPNGWRCRCKTDQVSDYYLRKNNLKVTDNPPTEERDYLNKRTGEVRKVPLGIDPGFDYNPGKAGAQALVRKTREFKPIRDIKESGKFNPPASDDLPAPQKVSADLLLRDTDLQGNRRSDEFFVETFLQSFGTTIGEKPYFLTDVTGHILAISDRMFLNAENSYKISNPGHAKQILLVAKALREPDEIWDVTGLEEETGKTVIRRRYLAHFEIENTGKIEHMFAIYETDKNGTMIQAGVMGDEAVNPGQGVTGFRAGRLKYLLDQRVGNRVYRRQ